MQPYWNPPCAHHSAIPVPALQPDPVCTATPAHILPSLSPILAQPCDTMAICVISVHVHYFSSLTPAYSHISGGSWWRCAKQKLCGRGLAGGSWFEPLPVPLTTGITSTGIKPNSPNLQPRERKSQLTMMDQEDGIGRGPTMTATINKPASGSSASGMTARPVGRRQQLSNGSLADSISWRKAWRRQPAAGFWLMAMAS